MRRAGRQSSTLRMNLFVPAEGNLPPGPYRTATELTQGLLQEGPLDLNDPSLYQTYFARYYQQVDTDEARVQEARKRLDFPAVAERFHMIGDETVSVAVPYEAAGQPGAVAALLQALQQQPARTREHLRKLQPYLVGLRPRELAHAQKNGLVVEVIPGLWEWQGNYDHMRGILLDTGYEPDRLIW